MIISVGTTSFALGSGRNEPASVQGLEGSRVLDVVPLTRADEAGVFDRKNVSHSLSVTVTRHHANVAAACDYVFDHPAFVFALSGDIVIESPSGKKWKLKAGKVERHTLAKWIGKTTVHNYTLRGAQLAQTT